MNTLTRLIEKVEQLPSWIFNPRGKVKTMSTNDAIELALKQLRQAVEVGKSIARVEIAVNIDAAEYLLGLAKATNKAIVGDDGEPTEAFKEAEDLQAEIDALNEDNTGHVARVAKRDGTILELQNLIENNTAASEERIAVLAKTIDDLQAELEEAIGSPVQTPKKGKKKGK